MICSTDNCGAAGVLTSDQGNTLCPHCAGRRLRELSSQSSVVKLEAERDALAAELVTVKETIADRDHLDWLQWNQTLAIVKKERDGWCALANQRAQETVDAKDVRDALEQVKKDYVMAVRAVDEMGRDLAKAWDDGLKWKQRAVALEALVSRVPAYTKHGDPDARRGDSCAPDCIKCQAVALMEEKS